MKKERKEIKIPKICTVYLSSDNQEFLSATDCFNHEVDIGRWKHKIVNHKDFYFISSLKEFNEFHRSLEEVLQHTILQEDAEYDFETHYMTHNVQDSKGYQSRPSKFPCYIGFHFNKQAYNPSIEYITLTNVLERYEELLANRKRDIEEYELLINEIRDLLTFRTLD